MKNRRIAATLLSLLILALTGGGKQAEAAMAAIEHGTCFLSERPLQHRLFLSAQRRFRFSSAIPFAHGIQHDILQLTPTDRHKAADIETDAEYLRYTYDPRRYRSKS